MNRAEMSNGKRLRGSTVRRRVSAGDASERKTLSAFLSRLGSDDRRALEALDTPVAIQGFLDSIPYSSDPFYRCPARVLRDRRGHCFDGATFAAAALRCIGYRPLLVDLYAERDDDHVLAVFREGRFFGALAQSNFVGIRYRDPVYRSLRELVMSYFDSFYNVLREKTMRGYTPTLDLRRLDGSDWMGADDGMERVANALDRLRRYPVVTEQQAASLAPMDERSFKAGMQGSDAAGLWRPGSSPES
jgi:hypothetical protein